MSFVTVLFEGKIIERVGAVESRVIVLVSLEFIPPEV
jgi:hypothetical protein